MQAFQSEQNDQIDITLSTTVERTATPLNIPVNMSVILTWEGKPDRYSISNFENPVLKNLSMTGSQNSSKAELRNGKIYTIKNYVFNLKPIELGMGYVESIIIEYTDNMTGVKDHLLTQRMSIKGEPPLYEKDLGYVFTISAIVMSVFLVFYIILWVRKTKMNKNEPETVVPKMEDQVLSVLKTIHSEDKIPYRNKIDRVISEFRKYLIDRFNIPEENKSAESFIEEITNAGLEDEYIDKIKKRFLKKQKF
ncbi:hypothetical protein ACFL7D_06435 [candidate division KSB1 bacterium]